MRILFSGYYGFGNAGDEAILAGTLDALRRRLPGCDLTVLSSTPEATREAYGVHAEQRWHRPTVWRQLGAADLLIQGGGGLIQDSTSRKSALYYLAILAAARARRTPYVIHAQGIGPLSGRLTRMLTGRLFRRAAAISVRDEGSAELLAQLRVPRESIVVTADPAALVDPVPPEDVAHLLPPRESGPRIGVALRAPLNTPESVRLVTLALSGAHYLAEEHGAQVVPLALHSPDDAELPQNLLDRMETRPVGADTPLSPGQWVSLVGSLDFVISIRLHACIFAATQGVPFVALSYDPKVAAFADGAGAECAPLDASVEDVIRLVEAAWSGRETGEDARAALAQRLRESAESNIDLIEEVLTGMGVK